MNWTALAFDWSHIRAFLATAEEGSLSAAARALRQSQPTVGRQVAALEEALGVTLFERTPRRLRLTEAGEHILEHARAMGQAALKLSLAATGESQTIEGRVSITATDFVAAHHLPQIVKTLNQIAPNLGIDIVASNTVQDLTQREADIAIRHTRPEQPELFARKIGEMTARFWAAPAYLDQIGRPRSVDQLAGASVIGFDDTPRFLGFLQDLGLPWTMENFHYATGSGPVSLELVRAGLGIGILTDDMAAMAPELEVVMPNLPTLPIPVWLVSHRELMTSRRIRLVFDLLSETPIRVRN